MRYAFMPVFVSDLLYDHMYLSYLLAPVWSQILTFSQSTASKHPSFFVFWCTALQPHMAFLTGHQVSYLTYLISCLTSWKAFKPGLCSYYNILLGDSRDNVTSSSKCLISIKYPNYLEIKTHGMKRKSLIWSFEREKESIKMVREMGWRKIEK